MGPYLDGAAGNKAAALGLYEWSARTSSAAFEIVGHLEVLLRNTLDRCLRRHFREDQSGIPWFLLPTPGGEHVENAVTTVRERLRPQRKESRHQIIAGLSFGFWSGLLGPKYEELWRDCLHEAFPNSSGKRKQVAVAVERVRKFRNRLAHHDSTINVDVPFEVRQIFELAAYIDVNAARTCVSQDARSGRSSVLRSMLTGRLKSRSLLCFTVAITSSGPLRSLLGCVFQTTDSIGKSPVSSTRQSQPGRMGDIRCSC